MGNSGRFPQGKPAATESRYLMNYKVHAVYFRVSTIHRTLTRTTWSLTCARDHSCSCVYTRELHGFTDSESAQHVWLGKTLTNVSCAPDSDGVRTSGLSISIPTLFQLSHPTSPRVLIRYWNPACAFEDSKVMVSSIRRFKRKTQWLSLTLFARSSYRPLLRLKPHLVGTGHNYAKEHRVGCSDRQKTGREKTRTTKWKWTFS